jgi:hypothetical protein
MTTETPPRSATSPTPHVRSRAVLVATGVWSAPCSWRGSIDIPTSGVYRSEADRVNRAGLRIDDRGIFDDTADGRATSRSGLAQLAAGRHAIEVRLQDRDQGGPRLYLYWTPPGGAREIVPGRVLYPPAPELSQ